MAVGDRYGDRFGGLTERGRLEWTVRVGLACVLGGVALWAVPLGAPWWGVVLLGAAAVVAAGLEVAARARG